MPQPPGALTEAISNPVPVADGAVKYEPADDPYVSPPRGRLRVTVTRQLSAEIVEYYRQVLGSQDVADVVGIARSTVLRVLRSADEPVKPWGVRYR